MLCRCLFFFYPGDLEAMRIAVISDIHGNLEAFEAVIADMAARRPHRVICLGDLVGYGPNPEEVVELFRRCGFTAVLGNHDAALHRSDIFNKLNFLAKENSLNTKRLMSQQSLDFCGGLPQSLTMEGALFVHGFPPSSLQQYLTLTSDAQLENFFRQNDLPLSFVGHSHALAMVSWNGQRVTWHTLQQGNASLDNNTCYIINGGSVGQPRDGNNNAKYLLWDSTSNEIEVRFVPYDYGTTIKKITERGFPKVYGIQLGKR